MYCIETEGLMLVSNTLLANDVYVHVDYQSKLFAKLE